MKELFVLVARMNMKIISVVGKYFSPTLVIEFITTFKKRKK